MTHIIKVNGEEVEIQPQNGADFKLRELQDIVGGYIETLPVANDQLMIINEEGKLMRLPINERATEIAYENGVFDCIVGDVVICTEDEFK